MSMWDNMSFGEKLLAIGAVGTGAYFAAPTIAGMAGMAGAGGAGAGGAADLAASGTAGGIGNMGSAALASGDAATAIPSGIESMGAQGVGAGAGAGAGAAAGGPCAGARLGTWSED